MTGIERDGKTPLQRLSRPDRTRRGMQPCEHDYTMHGRCGQATGAELIKGKSTSKFGTLRTAISHFQPVSLPARFYALLRSGSGGFREHKLPVSLCAFRGRTKDEQLGCYFKFGYWDGMRFNADNPASAHCQDVPRRQLCAEPKDALFSPDIRTGISITKGHQFAEKANHRWRQRQCRHRRLRRIHIWRTFRDHSDERRLGNS